MLNPVDSVFLEKNIIPPLLEREKGVDFVVAFGIVSNDHLGL
jgi:hypothetical protein